jgi:hypothetical protein
MRVTGGRVVLTPQQEQPYKVVLQHECGKQSEYPAATVKQGEALIRSRLQTPQQDQISSLRQTPRFHDTEDSGS